jgi:hypothetical protein
MSQERYAEACPKLEESQRLDPAGGTLLHLAICREHEGKIATAWAHYQEALASAKRDGRRDRAKIAQERIDALGPRLPRIRVRVAPANKKLSGFSLTRDDVPVGEAQWDDAIPVDPGTRVLRAQAEGYKPWSASVDVPSKPGEVTVDVPALEPDPTRKAEPVVAPATKETPGAPPRRIEEAQRGEGQRTLGLVAGGVGVAGLAVGTIFGLISMSKKSEADKECQPPDRKLCTQKGVDAGNAAITAGNVSTIGFIAGGVLVGAGAVLYFTAPSGSVAVGPSASPGGASLVAVGTFR